MALIVTVGGMVLRAAVATPRLTLKFARTVARVIARSIWRTMPAAPLPAQETGVSQMRCEHGVQAGGSNIPALGWNGPLGRCECCLGTFVYIDQGGWGSNGSSHSRYWHPKNRCGPCGGGYHEHSTLPSTVKEQEPVGSQKAAEVSQPGAALPARPIVK